MKLNNPSIRIGIVDDHLLFKKAIRMIFSSYPTLNIVLDASNGEDLIVKLQRNQPDIILLDLTMPGMDGFTVLPLIKKNYPSIKVIILSLHNDTKMRSELLALGACGYLSKTDEPKQFYDQITSCYLQ